MALLKSLTFTALPKAHASPALNRRAKVIARLEEQKLLLADPAYVRVTQRWVKGEDGQKSPVERRQRVLPWWRVDQTGAYVFFIRTGWKPVEFEKGKSAIVVPSLDRLMPVIDTLINAVRAGELDDQLAHSGKQPAAPKSRRAA